MLKRSKSLLIFVAVSTLALITGLFPLAHAFDVQSQVTIVGNNCGIVIDSGSPINYGSLSFNQESSSKQVSFTNNGNIPGIISVKGNNWKDALTQDVVMVTGATHWSKNSGDSYDARFALTDTDQETGVPANPGIQNSIYWQLKAALANVGYQGDAKQVVTISSAC